MRSIRLLLLLVCLLTALSSAEIKPCGDESGNKAIIDLESIHAIRMPHLSIGTNWTYPYAQIPIFSENQSINGSSTFYENGSLIELCISRFSVTELLRTQVVKTPANCTGQSLALNQTTDANFTLPELTSGLYTISAFDMSSTQQIEALLLLVTKERLSLQLPESILAGEPLNIKANISGLNLSKIFGAVMISAKDHENMSLTLISEESGSGYSSILKLGDKVQNLSSLTNISSDMALQLLYLLPSNSAAGMQESTKSEVELALLTDAAWQKGDYILTCAVYSEKEGLLDIKQAKIRVM